MLPPIKIINYIEQSGVLDNIIKPYLFGNICHCTDEKGFKKIISSGYIKYSDKSKNCYGYKHKLVCLADYRDLNKDKFQFDNIIGMLNQYIFVIKKEEHKNVISTRTQEQYESNKREGSFIPEYECWYKDKIELNKIEVIYELNNIYPPQPKANIPEHVIENLINYLDLGYVTTNS